MRARTLGLAALIGAIGLGATACDDITTSVEPETALLSVTPEGGTQDVNVDSTSVEVTFDHPMHDQAADYMVLHEGDVTGPEVMGSWTMEENGTHMRFVPDAPLKGGTQYTIHLGGDMMDEDGNHVNLETHGMGMGGMWATDSMMTGGMMGGSHSHMGEGWQHPDNGSYGMLFTFTTAVTTASELVAVDPQGGEMEVDPTEPVTVTFNHAIDSTMVDYAALHEGDINGPEVAGTWMMEQNDTVIRFAPASPLKGGTQYTIHIGGDMMDEDGNHVDLETHGMGMGGMWATDSMMTGGMMGGQHSHMGEGWQHPENGSYGMVFTFTTAGTAPSALVAVDPQGDAMEVDPTEPVTVTFNHAIDSTMVDYAALHEGDINGPEVAGTWSLSEDATQLIFTPDEALKPATQYTIHIGGDMMDEDGNHVDLETHGTHMGGEWADGSMMHGGMMGGDHPHMGGGWQHPDNGSYGMIFTFTTAA